jgi:hypothetical protein
VSLHFFADFIASMPFRKFFYTVTKISSLRKKSIAYIQDEVFSGYKGTVSRDFLLFSMNQFPPSPRVFHLDRFKCFRKFAEIFASQGAPPVSTTQVTYFSTIFASVVDTGGKVATSVNDTGG